jgi:hypothetical protein
MLQIEHNSLSRRFQSLAWDAAFEAGPELVTPEPAAEPVLYIRGWEFYLSL